MGISLFLSFLFLGKIFIEVPLINQLSGLYIFCLAIKMPPLLTFEEIAKLVVE